MFTDAGSQQRRLTEGHRGYQTLTNAHKRSQTLMDAHKFSQRLTVTVTQSVSCLIPALLAPVARYTALNATKPQPMPPLRKIITLLCEPDSDRTPTLFL